jgi:hypothetical protein
MTDASPNRIQTSNTNSHSSFASIFYNTHIGPSDIHDTTSINHNVSSSTSIPNNDLTIPNEPMSSADLFHLELQLSQPSNEQINTSEIEPSSTHTPSIPPTIPTISTSTKPNSKIKLPIHLDPIFHQHSNTWRKLPRTAIPNFIRVCTDICTKINHYASMSTSIQQRDEQIEKFLLIPRMHLKKSRGGKHGTRFLQKQLSKLHEEN